MKIEVGMYAYSSESREIGIGKIINIDENRTHLEVTIKTKKGKIITRKEYVVASFDIIDLIQVGDYVNSYRIDQIDKFKDGSTYLQSSDAGKYYCKNYQIKSVVTKEQFESIAYKVGEE